MEIELERTEEGVKVIKTITPEPEVSIELLNDDQLDESLVNIRNEIDQKQEVIAPTKKEIDQLVSHEAAIVRFKKSEELLVKEEIVEEVLESQQELNLEQ